MKIQADQLYDNYIITLDYGDRAMAVVESGFAKKTAKRPRWKSSAPRERFLLRTIGA